MTEKLLLVAGVTMLAMLSPGPDMVLVMRNTVTEDRRRGGLTALGVLTGNLFHIGYCTLGIASSTMCSTQRAACSTSACSVS